MAEFDVIVMGAGAAGSYAAVAAASSGLKVALFDEGIHSGHGSVDGVTNFFEHEVWSVGGEYHVDAIGPRGTVRCTARALIVATGATERIVPFAGWTIPGVIGLAAAMQLLTSKSALPGRSALVAGCGPLLAAVAVKAIESGGKIKAVADLAGISGWRRARSATERRSDLMVQQLKWWRTIRAAGTPRLSGYTVVGVESAGEGLRVSLARCDSTGRALETPRLTVLAGCLVVGHGFIPAAEATSLLRAQHCYSREAGGWVAVADEDGRTSRRLLYIAGDAAGIAGAEAAAAQGTLAGLTCAFDLVAANGPLLASRIAAARKEHQCRAAAGRYTAEVTALRAAQVGDITPETIICPCEDVTRAQLEAACDLGAHDMNQLKAWTRCGMGACQGRKCGDTAAELLMHRMGGASRETVGRFTARTPMRPVAVEALTGDFEYEDIAIPPAAPL